MESSTFNEKSTSFDSMESLPVNSSTCDAYRVKLYGKLHFVKRLKPQYANDIRYREALRKEFETGFGLEHPHLVRYIALDGDSLIIEHVDGETLESLLTSNTTYFTQRKNTNRLLLQLLDAVRYLHSHQILHLDLKPENIMLTHINHDVKIIDLGCCRTDSFDDTQGHTVTYAAPEQISGGDVDERTDIYAIGKIMEKLPNHYIYNKVISRCTALDKHKRYQSADELMADLKPSHHILPLVIGVALSALVLGMSYFAYFNQSKSEQPTVQVPVIDTIVQRTIVKQDTIIVPNKTVPHTKEPSVTTEEQALKELQAEILKAYDSTIKTFNDSIFPPPVPSPDAGKYWESATTSFNDQVKISVNSLSKKFPTISTSLLEMEAAQRFQALVGSVFNNMRKNGEVKQKKRSQFGTFSKTSYLCNNK